MNISLQVLEKDGSTMSHSFPPLKDEKMTIELITKMVSVLLWGRSYGIYTIAVSIHQTKNNKAVKVLNKDYSFSMDGTFFNYEDRIDFIELGLG